MASKNKTKQEREHLQAVVDLGCIACAKLGIYDSPAEIHHIKGKFRMGRKASHFETIPLCPAHHRNGGTSYHVNPREFTEYFGSQEELLEEVLDWLNVDGCPCGCLEATNDKNINNVYLRDRVFFI
jgi:hypothetical protein|tara:strand:- start:768 stop:1145 length:378 start_codon:yes stop_codon:yes gene_type:complete